MEISKISNEINELKEKLKETETKIWNEKDDILEENHYWKLRSEQLENSVIVLKRKMEDLDKMVDDVNTMNDELTKENDLLKTEVQNLSQTTTAHGIFLEMKQKENNQKTNEKQKEINRLQNELNKKDETYLNLSKEYTNLKDKFDEIEEIHNREKGLYQNTLKNITQLSQQEIQQTLKLIIISYFFY